jgi:hypothetical protein
MVRWRRYGQMAPIWSNGTDMVKSWSDMGRSAAIVINAMKTMHRGQFMVKAMRRWSRYGQKNELLALYGQNVEAWVALSL